jgi:hypothetical protein
LGELSKVLANAWFGYLICYVAIAGIYYGNVWQVGMKFSLRCIGADVVSQSEKLPFLSTSIFSNASLPGKPIPWNQTAVFGSSFSLNETALEEEGLPLFAGSYAWNLMTANWAVSVHLLWMFSLLWHIADCMQIGGLLAHVILFWGPSIKESVVVYTRRFSPDGGAPTEEEDVHYRMMKVYQEAPWWWYTVLLVLSFFAGLIVVLKGGTTLPVWGYILALFVGCESLLVFVLR